MDVLAVVEDIRVMVDGKYSTDIIARVVMAKMEQAGRGTLDERILNEIWSLFLDVDVLRWLRSNEEIEPEHQCHICLGMHKISQMYTLNCPSSHRFCYDCFRHFATQATQEGKLVTCPETGCKYTLTITDMTEVGLEEEIVRRYDKTLLQQALREMQAVGCPTRNCGNFIVPSSTDEREPCLCTKCGFEFCSLCQKKYHWRTTCAEVPEVEQRWLWWETQGRNQYWHQKVEHEEQYLRQLQTYIQAKSVHDKNLRELQERMRQEGEDERWKAENCRMCPQCGRTINKMEGCDAMRCGTDFHGGNIQNGCGAKFSWGDAHPYRPSINQRTVGDLNVQRPEGVDAADNGPYECELCGEPIKGLRFSCLNCRFHDVCEECESSGIATHQGHTFKIINLST